MTVHHMVLFALAFAGGLALGLVYLGLLRAGVRLLLHDGKAGMGAVLAVARLGIVGAGLWVAVQFGAAGLLGAVAGFTVMRILGTRNAGSFSWT